MGSACSESLPSVNSCFEELGNLVTESSLLGRNMLSGLRRSYFQLSEFCRPSDSPNCWALKVFFINFRCFVSATRLSALTLLSFNLKHFKKITFVLAKTLVFLD